MAGEEHVAVFEKSPFSVLGESTPGVGYDIDVPFGFPGRLNANFSNCPPKGEGFSGSVSLPGEAVLTGDLFSGGPSALIKTSPDGLTFDGSATAEEPEEDAELELVVHRLDLTSGRSRRSGAAAAQQCAACPTAAPTSS